VTVLANEYWAVENHTNYLPRIIQCNITTDLPKPGQDQLLAWELEGSGNWGPNMAASMWIAPNNNSWILLSKDNLKGPNGQIGEKWERYLLYHSTISNPGSYQIWVIMDSFDVDTVTNHDNPYTGWMALGDIGGVAFFLLILHTIVMTVAGVFFTNSSSFLNKPNSQEYTRITT